MTRPYSGIWPVAPTPFSEEGALDLEGMRRVIDCMIDQGVDGICILANFSEQFLLSDEERAELTPGSALSMPPVEADHRDDLALRDGGGGGAGAEAAGSGRRW